MKDNTLEYSWGVKDLRAEGKDSAEFYKPDAESKTCVMSITRADGKAVHITVDGEMHLSRELEDEDWPRVASCSQELPDIGVKDEKTLDHPDVYSDMNPWFDAYEDCGPFGDDDGHLDMVQSTLTHIIACVVDYLNEN